METTAHSAPQKHARRVKVFLIVGIIALAIIGLFLGVSLSRTTADKAAQAVPRDVAAELDFPLFVPGTLPSGFKLDSASFSVEEDGTLIFRASDDSGASLIFTEQRKPADFKFADFYNNQLKNAKNLADTPFPSVAGTAQNDRTKVLSVVAGDTWIFVSTDAPLGEGDLQRIAKDLRKDEEK